MSVSTASDEFRAAVEQAKLDAMKELAYGASHEINNPLANIAARAQTLLKQESDADRRKALEAIHRQAMRAHEMISDLMLFARPPALDARRFDLCELVQEIVEEARSLAADRSIRLVILKPRQPCEVDADRVQLGVAIKALVENSLEAIGEQGEVVIAIKQQPEETRLTVRDTGPGIAAEVREHIFDPFYSGREAGRGLGFGLSKCWRIVTDHGGRISVDGGPPLGGDSEEGAEFTITLPAQR